MDRWSGKVALVTGASSGIGKATAEKLAWSGMKVVACSPEIDALVEFASEVNEVGPGEMVAVQCDVGVEEDVLAMFKTTEEKFGALHVCVNCAGLAHDAPLLSGTVAEWNTMLAVNVVGLSICTREAVKMMQKHEVDDGHVIQISSMSGQRVTQDPAIHFYSATKHAVKALAEGLRQELRAQKSHIRTTCISPGDVETRFVYRMYPDDPETAKKIISARLGHIHAEDVADAVVYALSAPSRVDVNAILVRPTAQVD